MFKILAGMFIIYASANSYAAGDIDIAQVGLIAGIALIGAGLDTLFFNKK